MNQNPNPQPEPEPPDWSNLRRKIARVRSTISKCEETLDQVVCAMAQPAGPLTLPTGMKTHPGPTASERRALLKQQAARGVITLAAHRQADGGARVHIDGHPGIPLPPALAALLRVLSEDRGDSPDAFVAWKSIPEIKARLAKEAGWPSSERAVKQLVFRLRRELERHGENPYFIQNRPGLGYRFAVRRGHGPVTGCDDR